MPHSYITDGAEIYRRSFAMIRAEADLGRFTPEEEIVAVRMIHAAGMVGLESHIEFSKGMANRRPRGAGGWCADPVRCADGVRRCHPRPDACGQSGDLHAA
jgi:hypothetical protein